MSASQAEQIAGVRPILRRVVANAGLLLGGRTVNAILGLGAVAISARALGATQMGVLVLIQAFAMFLGEVVRFQSWQTIIHYGAQPAGEGRVADFQKVLRFTLALDLVSTAIGLVAGVVGSLAFAGLLGWSAKEAPAAALYMLSIAFMVSATPLGLLRLFDRFDIMAWQAGLISLIRLVTCAIAWWLHAGLDGFLLAWAAGTVGSWLYLAFGSFAELHKRGLLAGFSWRGPLAHGLPGAWRFAWNTNLASIMNVGFTHVVTLMMGGLIGPSSAAFWRVGRQVADALAKPAKLMTPALYPELARLRAEGRHDAMWRLARHVGVLAGGVGLVLLAVSALGGPYLLTLVMGPAFAPAADVMTWQVAAAVIGIFALPLEPMLVSLGKPGAIVRVRLIVGLVFLAGLPFLVKEFGLIGAGAGLTAAAGALALGMLWFILKENGIRPVAETPAPEPAERLKGDD